MDITFAAPKLPSSGAIVTGALAGKKLSPTAASLDKATGGALKRAIAASRFTGKKGEVLHILAPPKVKNSRIVLVGLGEPEKLKTLDLENLGGTAAAKLFATGETEASVAVDDLGDLPLAAAERAARYAYGARQRRARRSSKSASSTV